MTASSAQNKVNVLEVLNLLNNIVGKGIFELKGGRLVGQAIGGEDMHHFVGKEDPNSKLRANIPAIEAIFKDALQMEGSKTGATTAHGYTFVIKPALIEPDMVEALRKLAANKSLDEKKAKDSDSDLINLLNQGQLTRATNKDTNKEGIYVVFVDDEKFAAAEKALKSHPELAGSYRPSRLRSEQDPTKGGSFQIYNGLQAEGSNKVVIDPNRNLINLLNLGTPIRSKSPRTGKGGMYVVFDDNETFEAAKKALESDPQLAGSFRLAALRSEQDRTKGGSFQIYNSLQVDDSGKIIIADTQMLLNLGKPMRNPNENSQEKYLPFIEFATNEKFEGAVNALMKDPNLRASFRIMEDRTIQIISPIRIDNSGKITIDKQPEPAFKPKRLGGD